MYCNKHIKAVIAQCEADLDNVCLYVDEYTVRVILDSHIKISADLQEELQNYIQECNDFIHDF